MSFKWNLISTKSIQFFHQWLATNSLKQPKAQARWVPSKFKIILCIQLTHHNTFETLETSRYRNIHSKYIDIPIFPHLYRFPDNKLGQSIWDKMKCYKEHVGEHIENLRCVLLFGNRLGNTWRASLGTLWEYQNPKETPPPPHPLK
jgi:hypothetical protein